MAALLGDPADVETCLLMIDEVLPGVAETPASLYALAEQVPDDEGSAIIINELAVAFETLGRCVNDSPGLEVEELEFHFWVVEGWLEELGVRLR
jgi:hypothetical protein